MAWVRPLLERYSASFMSLFYQTGNTKARDITKSGFDPINADAYQDGMSFLKDRRDALGLSQAALADLAHTSAPQIHRLENGQRKLTREWAERLAPHLGLEPDELLFPDKRPPATPLPAEPPKEEPEPNVDLSKAEPVPAGQRFGGPRDVPVLGTAVGGSDEDGDFRFNGQEIDKAPRPPGIANRKDVFCLYVENDSMYPKFEPGERLYLDPHRKARVGEYVVVELYPEAEGDAGKGYIKKLEKRTPTRLIVSQFNPQKELEFELSRVKKDYRVIPTDELLGV